MKHLFYFVMVVLLSFSVQAAPTEYSFNITEEDTIIHNQDDWHFVTTFNGYDVYVEKNTVGSHEEIVRLHTYVSYHVPLKFYDTDVPVTALYVYGLIHCGRQQMMILMDFYVDKKNKIIFRTTYEPGAHVVFLNVPNTPRFDILNLVCKESI